MTEKEYQAEVIAWLREQGFKVHACGVAKFCDGKGFPDLLAVHPKLGYFFAELKMHSMSKVSPEQTTWGHILQAAGMPYFRWTLADWESRRVHADLGLPK